MLQETNWLWLHNAGQVGRQILSLEKVAKTISVVFHPFFVTLTAFCVVSYTASDGSVPETIGWLLLIGAVLFLPLTLLVFINVRRGKYSDLDISVRKQRHSFTATSVGAAVALTLLLVFMEASPILVACIVALIFGMIIIGITTLKTKVSLHAFGNAYSTAAVLWLHPLIGLVMAAIMLLVSWSRIYLKHHKPYQVALGLAIGFVSVGLVFGIHLG